MLYNQRGSEPESRPFVNCSVGSCRGSAILVVNKLNVCREHYENFHTSEALKWNQKMGLDTVDKRKDFVSTNIRQTIKSIKTTGV